MLYEIMVMLLWSKNGFFLKPDLGIAAAAAAHPAQSAKDGALLVSVVGGGGDANGPLDILGRAPLPFPSFVFIAAAVVLVALLPPHPISAAAAVDLNMNAAAASPAFCVDDRDRRRLRLTSALSEFFFALMDFHLAISVKDEAKKMPQNAAKSVDIKTAGLCSWSVHLTLDSERFSSAFFPPPCRLMRCPRHDTYPFLQWKTHVSYFLSPDSALKYKNQIHFTFSWISLPGSQVSVFLSREMGCEILPPLDRLTRQCPPLERFIICFLLQTPVDLSQEESKSWARPFR